jgi:hypothetical protein
MNGASEDGTSVSWSSGGSRQNEGSAAEAVVDACQVDSRIDERCAAPTVERRARLGADFDRAESARREVFANVVG